MWIHDNKGWNLDECVLKVRCYEEMFRMNNILANSMLIESDVIVQNKWTIFCDGSWCKLTNKGGFAAVAIIDDIVMACRVGWMDSCTNLL